MIATNERGKVSRQVIACVRRCGVTCRRRYRRGNPHRCDARCGRRRAQQDWIEDDHRRRNAFGQRRHRADFGRVEAFRVIACTCRDESQHPASHHERPELRHGVQRATRAGCSRLVSQSQRDQRRIVFADFCRQVTRSCRDAPVNFTGVAQVQRGTRGVEHLIEAFNQMPLQRTALANHAEFLRQFNESALSHGGGVGEPRRHCRLDPGLENAQQHREHDRHAKRTGEADTTTTIGQPMLQCGLGQCNGGNEQYRRQQVEQRMAHAPVGELLARPSSEARVARGRRCVHQRRRCLVRLGRVGASLGHGARPRDWLPLPDPGAPSICFSTVSASPSTPRARYRSARLA